MRHAVLPNVVLHRRGRHVIEGLQRTPLKALASDYPDPALEQESRVPQHGLSTGLGTVGGIHAQGFGVPLHRHPEANFYTVGITPSVVLGSVWERESSRVVQRAAWVVLNRSSA